MLWLVLLLGTLTSHAPPLAFVSHDNAVPGPPALAEVMASPKV